MDFVNLKKQLRINGISLSKFAKMIDMKPTSISMMFKRGSCSGSTLEKIQKVLKELNSSVAIKEDITIFLKNGNFMNVDSISGCIYCGKWHYKCVKGKAIFYVPFHSLDYTHHETFDDEEEEKCPTP